MNEIRYRGYVIKISQDANGINPRSNYDPLGIMVCYHRRYSLGDSSERHGLDDCSKYDGWDEVEEAMKKIHNTEIILPLYLYDHGGITISTNPFSCRWDSGQIGFICMPEKAVGELKNCTESKLYDLLREEVDEYDSYLTGEQYCYNIYFKDELIDSCCGFSGCDHDKSGLMESAKNAIDCILSDPNKAEQLEFNFKETANA